MTLGHVQAKLPYTKKLKFKKKNGFLKTEQKDLGVFREQNLPSLPWRQEVRNEVSLGWVISTLPAEPRARLCVFAA